MSIKNIYKNMNEKNWTTLYTVNDIMANKQTHPINSCSLFMRFMHFQDGSSSIVMDILV